MKSEYDVIVVGGGPAGSSAARHAASRGAAVVLLEKDREIGVPVRCAEGVSHASIAGEVEIDPRWIAQKITGASLHAPSGAEVLLHSDQVGYILHRKLFDYDLAQMAAAAGVSIFTKACVCGLIMEGGRICGVELEHLGERRSIRGRIVIAADGVESRVARWAGLKTRTAMADMESCAQVTVGSYAGDPEIIHFYFSRQMAPGGYIWIFPKGHGMANIGIGLTANMADSRSPHDCLNDFLERFFPGIPILGRVYGGVPCSTTLKEIVTDGLMVVGDAAHQVNPLTGGGIALAMIGGRLAGETAAAAIAEGRNDRKQLEPYARAWHAQHGSRQVQYYRLRKFVFSLQDSDFNGLAGSILALPEDKRTMLNIFKAALIQKPSLILDAIKLFT
jgi:digeranylgeranylglycerophospholipid reductase